VEDSLTNAGITIQYNSPYSKFKPLTVFEPTGVTSPNPNLNPPVGFHLNNQTGALTFTPVTQSEVTVISLMVSEFRKGILIGKTRREMQFWIDILDNNIAHTVSAPKDFCVLAGDTLNFNVLCSDAADTTFGGSVDSLFLTWDNAFVGPLFSVISGLYKSGTIHWAPSSDDARDEPYMLTFRATDNSCPYNLAVQKTVRIKVVDRIYVALEATFNWSQKGDTSIFNNTSEVPFSDIDSVQWLINGSVVSNLHSFDSILPLDTTNDIELRMYYDIKSDCGSLFVGGDTSSKTIMPKSCKASYVISLDTDTTNPYRIFLVNNSRGSGLSTKWTFSGGDSVLGAGTHNFTKFGKYEVCLEVSNVNCTDVYCDSVGMDSSRMLYKKEGFTVPLLNENEVNSVPEITSEGVYKIFPNPVNNKIYVSALDGKRINIIELMDSKGQFILDVQKINDLQITLHFANLRGGIYFLRVFSRQNVTTKKLYKL